jgi:hypothetical protein
MRGTHLLKEGNVYKVASIDTTYPRLRYMGSRDHGRYLHFYNVGDGNFVSFDQDHKNVIRSQYEIFPEDILELLKQK